MQLSRKERVFSSRGSRQAERKSEKLSSVTASGIHASIFSKIPNGADGILTTELAGKIIIQSAAVQKNNVRGGGKLLPAKLSAQQCQIAAKVTAAECM